MRELKCTRCSDVIELGTKTRRHVGGIINVNGDGIKTRKSENADANLNCTYIATISAVLHKTI